MNQLELNSLKENTLYVHLFASGELFVVPGNLPAGYRCDFPGFLLELTECAQRSGILYYSIEEDPTAAKDCLNSFLDVVISAALETQMVHPHPQVYGYYKSYLPYLNDALEVAAMDIKGLLQMIDGAEKELENIELGTNSFNDLLLLIEDLKSQYSKAYLDLNKLANLHYELIADDLSQQE